VKSYKNWQKILANFLLCDEEDKECRNKNAADDLATNIMMQSSIKMCAVKRLFLTSSINLHYLKTESSVILI
jgi:hypothetical protein